MAFTANSTPVPAQQPDLRSFIVCDRLPEGCIAFPITTDHTLPHLRPGDIAIIDPTDCDPEHGELFVIEFGKSTDHPTKCVVETWLKHFTFANTERGDCGWMVGAYNRPKSVAQLEQRFAQGRGAGAGIWCDGPYRTSGSSYDCLVDKIVGRVVGILEPAYDGPKRLMMV